MRNYKTKKTGNGILLLASLALFSCKGNVAQADAYGNFEAEEVIVAAETRGRILEFVPEEGDKLHMDMPVVLIDTMEQHLKKLQLESGRSSLDARVRTLNAQISASEVQLENLQREKERIDRMAEGGAATSKQQDDIQGQIAHLEAQIAATRSQISSVNAERRTLEVQVLQVQDQLERCLVTSPGKGVLLSSYKRKGEMAIPGQALFKMADLSQLVLRVFVSGEQLSQVKLGHKVEVLYDGPEGLQSTGGTVSWVSSRAEFTPKIIQTREERVNLVYAVKVLVPNEGSLKIGMPGEIRF